MPRATLAFGLFSLTLLAAAPAHGDARTSALSGSGPGDGHGRAAAASGVMVVQTVALPTLAFDYTRGLGERFDFVASVDVGLRPGSPLISVSALDLGVRARVTPADSSAHVGFTLSPELLWLNAGGASLQLGLDPGVFASAGTPDLQVTAALDAPIYFVDLLTLDSAVGPGPQVTLRPHLTLEAAVSPALGVVLSTAVDLAVGERSGVQYVEVTGGLSF